MTARPSPEPLARLPRFLARVRLEGELSATQDMLERLLGALLADEVGRERSKLRSYAVTDITEGEFASVVGPEEVVVPREPTEAMIQAGRWAFASSPFGALDVRTYDRALRAALAAGADA